MIRTRFRGWLCGILVCAATAAHAGAIQLAGPTALSPSDAIFAYSDADGSAYANTVTYAAAGNTITIATSNNTLTRYTVGVDYFFSAFPNGTPILYYGDNFGANAPATLSFGAPVSEVGFNLEDAASGDYTITFTAFNGVTALGTFTSSGNDPNSLGFVGVAATSGDAITRLGISDNRGNNLTFGPITFGTTIPEPGSLALIAVGLVGLVGMRRQRPSVRR